eukprot:scaffold129168_cov41-Prasinocladus_malaysianus.AAC.1
MAKAEGNTTHALVGRDASIRLTLKDEFGNDAVPPLNAFLGCSIDVMEIKAEKNSGLTQSLANFSCHSTDDPGTVEAAFNVRQLGRFNVTVALFTELDEFRRRLQQADNEAADYTNELNVWADSYGFVVEVVEELPAEAMTVSEPEFDNIVEEDDTNSQEEIEPAAVEDGGVIPGLSPAASVWVLVGGGAGLLMLMLAVLTYVFWWQPRATKISPSIGLAARDGLQVGDGPVEDGADGMEATAITPRHSRRASAMLQSLVSPTHMDGSLPPVRPPYLSPSKSQSVSALPAIKSPADALKASQEARELWGSGRALMADFIRELSSQRIIVPTRGDTDDAVTDEDADGSWDSSPRIAE